MLKSRSHSGPRHPRKATETRGETAHETAGSAGAADRDTRERYGTVARQISDRTDVA